MSGAYGAIAPLIMTLPIDVAREPGEVGAMVAMMLGFGYSLAATAPLLLGAIRDATGSFTGVLWVLAAFAGVVLALATLLTTERLRRGVAHGRQG